MYNLRVLCLFFVEQSCEVFRIAGIGCAVALGAEFLVAADEVGSVKRSRVIFLRVVEMLM